MPRARRKPLLIAAVILVLTLVGGGAGWAAYMNHQIGEVRRITVDFGPDRGERSGGTPSSDDGRADSGPPGDAAAGQDDSRPRRDGEDRKDASSAGAQPMTLLVAGVDAGDGPRIADDLADGSWTPGRYRSDSVMVVHLPADRESAQVVSIPRDTLVEIPGHGSGKLNSAFSLGGPSLAVKTVERLVEADLDHLMIVDWEAFRRITTAVGGVRVRIPQDVHDSSQDVHWSAGVHRLEGKRALQYVRQRHGLPRGDFNRIDRQQNFLRATLAKVLSNDTLMDPVKVTRVLQTVGDHLLVDDGLSSEDLRSLALSVRGLSQDDVQFLTVPTAALDTVRGQEVVRVDRTQTRQLFRALQRNRLGGYLERNDADVLKHPDRVR